jgi:hypothetical protein
MIRFRPIFDPRFNGLSEALQSSSRSCEGTVLQSYHPNLSWRREVFHNLNCFLDCLKENEKLCACPCGSVVQ